MSSPSPRVTVCIPHWQVQRYMTLCLRALRKHSTRYDLEVIVVDNGSKDGSLDYLRSLKWIKLIERPDEVHTNWPLNVFTAWDRGLEAATGDYYITMHSDVFIRRDDWLDPLLWQFEHGENIAAAGAWKLDLEHPVYAWQKKVFGYLNARIKTVFGRKKSARWKQQPYPRDYCAMYRSDILREHQLTFCPKNGCGGGGLSIAKQIWDAGYQMGMVPVREMADHVFHVAHGTAALAPEKPLNHRRAQKKVENKVSDLFEQDWIRDLELATELDAPGSRARAA